jgi:hypothetical protein
MVVGILCIVGVWETLKLVILPLDEEETSGRVSAKIAKNPFNQIQMRLLGSMHETAGNTDCECHI